MAWSDLKRLVATFKSTLYSRYGQNKGKWHGLWWDTFLSADRFRRRLPLPAFGPGCLKPRPPEGRARRQM